VHQFWQKQIHDVLEAAGRPASIEAFDDADVYSMIDGVEVAVEVAMGDNEREVEHVEKHLDTYDMVWIACRNEAVRDELRQRLGDADLLDKDVVLRLVEDFVNPEDTSVRLDD